MKRKVYIAVAVVLLLTGLCILLYPTVTRLFSHKEINTVVEDFKASIETVSPIKEEENILPSAIQESTEGSENSDKSASQKAEVRFTAEQSKRLYEDFYAYNLDLIENGQSSFGDPFIFEDESISLAQYGLSSSVAAVVSAPAINMELPVYLGATEENMYMGAAHLSRTSLPIGGESTNSVIAGHTGMVNAVMFDNIVKLNKGDDVYITNFWDTLSYKVIDTKIIEPKESNEILIEKGRDLVTLITCYPYGSNTHRYLVICERVK